MAKSNDFANRVQNIAVLDPSECAAVRDTIMRLRLSWLRRNLALPFYTLGAASYIDAAQDAETYHRLARQFNPVLAENFGWLHKRVAAVIAREFSGPAESSENLALPGFHIYLSSKVFEKPVASVHCDSQYNFHNWSGMDADLSRHLSFTLSIALPTNGGGLNTWDVTLEELSRQNPPDLGALMKTRKQTYHPYHAGHLALHSGHILHQAAPGRDVQPNDERITMQGHAIRANGIWRLYW